jgi:hypothetical protein
MTTRYGVAAREASPRTAAALGTISAAQHMAADGHKHPRRVGGR